jgi:hypothetical protein
MTTKKALTTERKDELLDILKSRFDNNMNRHKELKWSDLESKLIINESKLWSLNEMELSGGEPDVIGYDKNSNEFNFVDCSEESPKGRRSLCYDREGLESRKEHKPDNTAVDLAREMGVDLLTEEQYRGLQELGEFDLKTSSWVLTPDNIRGLGGAIFCDRRYDTVFTYHNGAQSYYASRGFRSSLNV